MKSILVLSLLLSISIQASPVSYANGWTVMQRNNFKKNRLHIHYSPTIYHSIGLVLERELLDEISVNAQWNHLFYRENTLKSRTNLYTKLRAGINDDFQPNINFDVSYDWETRRYFRSIEISNELFVEFDYRVRLGVAPYIAKYNALHTWIMLELEVDQNFDLENIFVTPLIRCFKGDILLELGYTFALDINSYPILFNFVLLF